MDFGLPQMQIPGLPGQDQQDQQQQPLFGQPTVNPVLSFRQALAAQLAQQQQDQEKIASPYQLAAHVVSPLVNALAQSRMAKRQQEQQQAEQDAAMPEIAAALKSGDIMGSFANSKSPLTRQLLFQLMPEYMKQHIASQAEVDKATALIAPHVAEANALAEPNAKAAGMKAGAEAQAGLATKLKEIAAGQAVAAQNAAETARHNRVTEGKSSDNSGAGYKPPWEQ